jgi:ribosomal protein S18 acetylase RimI-like enzyme
VGAMVREEIETFLHGDAPKAIAVLQLAFVADPIWRWGFRDALTYQKYTGRFIEAFGGRAFDAGTAETCGEGAGVALWLPPGVEPDAEAMMALFEESFEESRKPDLFAILAQMEEHHVEEPHWYLPLIGVDPRHQGRGHGSKLLEHAANRCDRQGLPAYLEASSHQNRRLYERYGFEAIGEIQAGDSPTVVPMLRRPRGR